MSRTRTTKPPRGAFDPKSGAIVLDDDATRLAPSLSRTAFLASALAKAAKPLVVNEPWRTFELADRAIGSRRFHLMLSFEGEALQMIVLTLADARYGTSWSDYSEKKEAAKHAAHRRWLVAQFKARGLKPGGTSEQKFAWGSLWAGHDQRDGDASIVVSYGKG